MYADTVKQFFSILPSVSLAPRHSWSVLGSLLTHEAIVPILGSKLGDIRRLCSKLEEVDPHHAFTLLRNCFSIPKLVHILRTCPTFVEPMISLKFDSIICAALSSVFNISLSLASNDLQGGDRDVVLVRESWQKQRSVAPLDLLENQRNKG